MRLKWYFRNEPTSNFSEVPAFRTKSTWNPPKGHPNLEVFLSEVEKELFSCTSKKLGYSNLSTEEWKAMRSLADDRSIVIKKTDKGSSVVVWDRNDYVMEAEKQLSDANVYKDVSFNEKMLQDLVGTSNKLFQNLKSKGKISNKQLKYFTYEYKKATNLGKLYLLPKIHKRLSNVPGRPVISSCGTPTEKTSIGISQHFFIKSQHILMEIMVFLVFVKTIICFIIVYYYHYFHYTLLIIFVILYNNRISHCEGYVINI